MRASGSNDEGQDTGNSRAVVDELASATVAHGLAGQAVLVAASGGVDSTVLADALASLARVPLAGLGHVHHGLRGAEADGDAASVEALAERLGVPFRQRRVDLEARRDGVSSRDRPTLQEAARAVRYEALAEMAHELGAERVATAHTADDQAETVLLRLFRGTGPDGLAGIPPVSPDGRIVRPLLRVSRADVLAYARARGLRWREDASNASDAYARSRLRRHWLPGLSADFNPRLLRAVADLAEAQRRDSEWIGARVAVEADRRLSVEGAWLRFDAKDLPSLPDALARRVAREALLRAGRGRLVTRVHLARMLRFLAEARPGTRLELPGDLLLLRDPDGYRLGPLPSGAPGGGPPGAC